MQSQRSFSRAAGPGFSLTLAAWPGRRHTWFRLVLQRSEATRLKTPTTLQAAFDQFGDDFHVPFVTSLSENAFSKHFPG